MTLRYAWFDSYDSVGYVLTLHIFPHTICHRSLGMGRYGGVFLLGAQGGGRSATGHGLAPTGPGAPAVRRATDDGQKVGKDDSQKPYREDWAGLLMADSCM